MIGCVAGRYVLSGQSSTESGGYHGEHHHFSAGFGIKGIMEAWVRQYGLGLSQILCKVQTAIKQEQF